MGQADPRPELPAGLTGPRSAAAFSVQTLFTQHRRSRRRGAAPGTHPRSRPRVPQQDPAAGCQAKLVPSPVLQPPPTQPRPKPAAPAQRLFACLRSALNFDFVSKQPGETKTDGERCFLKARAPAASVWPWGWRKDESHPGRTRGSAAQGTAEGAGEAWVCRSSSGSLPGDPRAVARSTARSPVEQGHYYERFLCTSEVSLANCTDRPSQSERWSSTPRLPRDRESLAPRAAKAAPNPADGRCPDQRSGCECQGRGIPIAPRCHPEEPVALLPSTRPLLL